MATVTAKQLPAESVEARCGTPIEITRWLGPGSTQTIHLPVSQAIELSDALNVLRGGGVFHRVLRVRFDRVYGKITCYPDCDDSERIARLSKTKTLSPESIDLCKALGYRITCGPASLALLEEFAK